MLNIDSLRADAVFAWRQLNKRKATSAAAILSLGLGLGACATAFRFIDALFLRPLPINNPQNLFMLSRPAFGDGWEHIMFDKLRDAVKGDPAKNQIELIAVSIAEQTDLRYVSDPDIEKAGIQYVSGWMFRAFGLRPAAGRLLSDDDDLEPGAHAVAVISYDYWTRRFGRDPNVVGRTVTIARKYGMGSDIFEIVGVAGKGFTGTEPGDQTELFVPAAMHPLVNLPVAALFRTFVILQSGIAPGPVRDRLNAALYSINHDQVKEFPDRLHQTLVMESASSGVSGMQKNYGQALMALGMLVALVLLIACANVANLLSAQSAARRREMALRVSIGAGRGRLVQLVLVESAMFAFLAAMAGAIVTWQAAPFVVAHINPPDDPARLSLAPDWRVIVVGLVLTLAVVLLLTLAPALRVSAVMPANALRGGEDSRSRGRLMNVLIAVQAAFCFLVLFVAGLFAATFNRIAHQPAGFPVDGLIALDTVTPRDEPPSAWEQVAEHLRSVPGVETTAVSEWALLDGNGFRFNRVSIEGGPPTEARVRFLITSPNWIETMKIPLIEGRDFREKETEAAIVSLEFVKQYFPGEDPIGKWFQANPGGEWGHRFQIVGVAGDTRYRRVRDPIVSVAYIPNRAPWHAETLMVRVSPSQKNIGTLALAAILKQEVSRARPGFRVTKIRTQEGMLQAQTVRERLLAMLALFFAGVALLLAGVGLYGVLDYSVFRRRREIGIRMAIGAPAGSIVRLVTVETFVMVLTGALAGGAIGTASARYIATLLYQVSPTDLNAVVPPLLIILTVGALAAVPGVLRAIRVDPVTVLRAD